MSISVKGSFRRSINLARDFYGNQDLDGYIVTAKVIELVDRISDALSAPIASRAWSITGPYGGGKSAFALFLAHLLKKNQLVLAKLNTEAPELSTKLAESLKGVFCPILIEGGREPIANALLRELSSGLSAYLEGLNSKGGKANATQDALASQLIAIAQKADEHQHEANDQIVLELFQQAAAVINNATGGGLLLVVDELGKMLEYAADYPEKSDLYVLQRLAEKASRTDEAEAPSMLVFTILHQAFDRYANRLSSAQRDEWRKVQGRFEDIAFIEPVSETLRLLSHAIERDTPARLPTKGDEIVEDIIDATSQGTNPEIDTLRKHLGEALPLHPVVSLIVGPLFRRLAQNERSLFAFLGSREPHSFLDVMEKEGGISNESSLFGEAVEKLPFYRLDHLYDYLVGTLGAALFDGHVGRLWAEAEGALARLDNPTEITERLLKQIALLSFVGPLAGIRPSSDVLKASVVAGDSDKVDEALELLQSLRLINYRNFKDEYHLWQGSDFDIDSAMEEAKEHVPSRTPLAKLLANVLPPLPLTARRHSYRTGTTRVFEVHYVAEDAWQNLAKAEIPKADGRIIYILPEQNIDKDELIENISKEEYSPLTLFAFPKRTASLREIVRELTCLDWIRENNEDMQGDNVARLEIDRRRADRKGYIQQQLTNLLHKDEDGNNPCIWINNSKVFHLKNDRALQDKLSQICYTVFGKSPEIWNELLNRRKPSSNAIKALKMLLYAMVQNSDKPRLGIEKYPAEYGLYASILEVTGLHIPDEDEPDVWHFTKPDSEKKPGLAAVWEAIEEAFKKSQGQKISVQNIYDVLREPPYGVREGLIPVFLFSFYMHAQEDIAVYESGTFVSEMNFQTIERLIKTPSKFDMQWVEIHGTRAEVLQVLAPLVGLSESLQKPLPFVLRILSRIHGLPPYVRRTTSLSEVALNVRETLHRAVEPATLLFEDLPQACQISSFLSDDIEAQSVVIYVSRLQEALRELGNAYKSLISDLQSQFTQVFHLREKTMEDRRHEFAERAKLVLPIAADFKLKAFLVRATDEMLDTQGWFESLAALLAKRPPVQWGDEDRAAFNTALRETARHFYTLEPIAFDVEQDNIESPDVDSSRVIKRVRLSVTVQYEDEREQVISIHPEDSDIIESVYQRLQGAMDFENETLETKLAALGKLTQELLEQREQVYIKKEPNE